MTQRTVFRCSAQRFKDRVEIVLPRFKFAVRVRKGEELRVRLANGVTVGFHRPEPDVKSIRVFLQHGETLGQRVQLQSEEVRWIGISGQLKLHETCKRQLAAQRMCMLPVFVVHVSENAEIVYTGEGTADGEFVDGVACCSQGPETSPAFPTVIYVRESASDYDVAKALFREDHASGLPSSYWATLMRAYVDLDAALQIANLVAAESYETDQWLHYHSANAMELRLVKLLAIHGPPLIIERVTGRAKQFLECFTLPDSWEPNNKSWYDRLSELPRNPWHYIRTFFRIRGVRSGERTFLWITDQGDADFQKERRFYDSASDTFAQCYPDDLRFLLKGQTPAGLAVEHEIPTLLGEPLLEVVDWHETPATVKWSWDRKRGNLEWNGRAEPIERKAFSTSDLTPISLSPLAFSIDGSFSIGEGLAIRNIEQLWARGQLSVLSENRYGTNMRFEVVRVLKDGDPAGVFDSCQIVSEAATNLVLLLRNGEGDHLVVSLNPNDLAAVEKKSSAKVAPIYRLVFRGEMVLHTFSCQPRRQDVFVERIRA